MSANLLLMATSMLGTLIGSDEVLWTDISAVDGSTVALTGTGLELDLSLSQALSVHGLDHPAVQSYRRPGDDLSPRRVSDVTANSAWVSSNAYNEVFRQRSARFQLSIVVSLNSERGRGWVLTRSSRDFDDRDVEVAGAVLPLLAAVEQQLSRPEVMPLATAEPVALTARELGILRLLGVGMTAQAIGHASAISEATVRKHLEHIYRKLGTNDRLTTVARAQRLGLLPTS